MLTGMSAMRLRAIKTKVKNVSHMHGVASRAAFYSEDSGRSLADRKKEVCISPPANAQR